MIFIASNSLNGPFLSILSFTFSPIINSVAMYLYSSELCENSPNVSSFGKTSKPSSRNCISFKFPFSSKSSLAISEFLYIDKLIILEVDKSIPE